MFKRLVLLWILLLAASCGGGGGSAPAPAQSPVGGPTPAEQLAQDLAGLSLGDFYETSYGALLSRSPESVIWLALTAVYPLNDLGRAEVVVKARRHFKLDVIEIEGRGCCVSLPRGRSPQFQ